MTARLERNDGSYANNFEVFYGYSLSLNWSRYDDYKWVTVDNVAQSLELSIYQNVQTGSCEVSVSSAFGNFAIASIGIGGSMSANSQYPGYASVFFNGDPNYPTGYTGQKVVGPATSSPYRIDYLAIGDSLSSGEGDLGLNPDSGKKYYRAHTDDDGTVTVDGYIEKVGPTEKCHLSERSYPYALANGMGLGKPSLSSTARWNSVACSGATSWDLKEKESADYTGQGDRLNGYDISSLRAGAINEFIPGRLKQIEFIKRYQPKVITLTMGGNDVDFAGKIRACASSPSVCSFANLSWRGKLRSEIRAQFDNLSGLYEEITGATEYKAKVYVLGYPMLVNGNPYASCDDTFFLGPAEREMISNSIIYLNNIIEQAAKKAGVKYVDIESAFGDHRLCDAGTQHVTAITGILGYHGYDEQESFHPNSLGHSDIANAVWDTTDGQSLLDYQICADATKSVCPDSDLQASGAVVPPYFSEGSPTDNSIFHYYTLTNGTMVKMVERYSVDTQNYVFESESKVDLLLYSSPTILGQFDVGLDGSVRANVTIPASVLPGYHTLVMRGKSPGGEVVELYQTVQIRGSSTDDIDEDGVSDVIDKCFFVPSVNIDVDKDDKDDACDPEVNSVNYPYRVRMGDPRRSYAGRSEVGNYLYVERRTDASEITGISGDDDPDGDGWAIIAASEGRTYSPIEIPDTGPYARFSIDDIQDGDIRHKVPSIYLRAGNHGCVRYQPESLARLEPGQIRGLKLVSQGIDKCRAEPPEADMDHDGQPDNSQPLYLARNGDVNIGEDPERIYLFRNFHAAEAQLGISDYSPAGTPAGQGYEPVQTWNILAISKGVGYTPSFKKLITTVHSDGSKWPVIIFRKHDNLNPGSRICFAYTPSSLAQIQSNEQQMLVNDKELIKGVSCEKI